MSLIDPKKIVADMMCGAYAVTFSVFIDNEKKPAFTPDEIKKRCKYELAENRACFASLRRIIGSFMKKNEGEKPTHMLFALNYEWCGRPQFYLDVETRQWWIDLCQKHGVMPKEIGKDVAETGHYKIRISDLDMNQIYLYLWAARLMHEEPYYVTNMHYLIEEIGLDFFVAMGVASCYCIRGSGHNIMDTTRGYGSTKGLTAFDISQAMAVPRFLREYKPKKTVATADAPETMLGFQMQNTLRTLSDKKYRTVAEKDLKKLKAE
jgi:hypothetical protein